MTKAELIKELEQYPDDMELQADKQEHLLEINPIEKIEIRFYTKIIAGKRIRDLVFPKYIN